MSEIFENIKYMEDTNNNINNNCQHFPIEIFWFKCYENGKYEHVGGMFICVHCVDSLDGLDQSSSIIIEIFCKDDEIYMSQQPYHKRYVGLCVGSVNLLNIDYFNVIDYFEVDGSMFEIIELNEIESNEKSFSLVNPINGEGFVGKRFTISKLEHIKPANPNK